MESAYSVKAATFRIDVHEAEGLVIKDRFTGIILATRIGRSICDTDLTEVLDEIQSSSGCRVSSVELNLGQFNPTSRLAAWCLRNESVMRFN